MMVDRYVTLPFPTPLFKKILTGDIDERQPLFFRDKNKTFEVRSVFLCSFQRIGDASLTR